MSKADDVLTGALHVFARNGYTRSSIVMIAAQAKVSTRTIYNRYVGKAELFEAVIEHSTRRRADHHIQLVRQATAHRALRPALLELARCWACEDARFDDHQALVRQVQAEREHIPQGVLDTWVTLGPLRVRALLADELCRLFAGAGVQLDDPSGAATHLTLLIGGDPISRGFYREDPLTEEYLSAMAQRGAEVFLAAYAGPTAVVMTP